jgi:L-alanine-DL-glutamate epimerase-like enolase superfamily enzyme
VIMKNEMKIEKGYAYPYDTPGLGIEWNWKAIDRLRVAPPAVLQANASNATRRRAK